MRYLQPTVPAASRYLRVAVGRVESLSAPREGALIKMTATVKGFAWGGTVLLGVGLGLVAGGGLGTPTPVPEARVVEGWEEFHRGGISHGSGSPSAILISVFSDHRCVYCMHADRMLVELLESGLPIRVMYRHRPILGFASSLAAGALECAAQQGQFRAMNSALFTASDTLGLVDFWALASGVGVSDSLEFRECTEGGGLEAVRRDLLLADELGVTGTPGVLIDSLLYAGFPGADVVRAHVDRVGGA